jgi:hypothetical protein
MHGRTDRLGRLEFVGVMECTNKPIRAESREERRLTPLRRNPTGRLAACTFGAFTPELLDYRAALTAPSRRSAVNLRPTWTPGDSAITLCN